MRGRGCGRLRRARQGIVRRVYFVLAHDDAEHEGGAQMLECGNRKDGNRRKEEGVLFQTMTDHGVPVQGGPVGTMLSEHEWNLLVQKG